MFLTFQINWVRRAEKGDWLPARGQKLNQGRKRGLTHTSKWGFPDGSVVKIHLQCRRCRRLRFDP